MEKVTITKANLDTLSEKIDNYNSFNDSLTLAEIQHRAKELFGKEIPLEILQNENHHQEFCGWLMREVNPVIEFDNGMKKEIVKNPQPDNELGDFVFSEAKPIIQEEFDFDNLPDGVGFETDKGIFTFCRDDDAFSNRKDNIHLEIDSDFDSALTFAVRYGSVEKAIQAIDSGQELKYEKNHRARVKNILEQAKEWTFVFDVHNDTTEILRGEEAKKAVLDTIAKQQEYDARRSAIRNIDLKTKPKTNAEKLQQFFKKAAHQQYNPMLYGDDYMKEGVKQFLLSSPNVKLEQMTKLIDAVAPDAVYNSQYTENLKTRIKNDKDFQAKLAANKKSVSAKGR